MTSSTMFSSGYFLAFVMMSYSFAGVSSTVTWDKQDIEVKEGDDVSLKCTVTGLGALDVIRVVHILDKQTVTIADSSDVKSPFSSLPRYKVHYDFNGSIGSVLLHYRGILGRDSGDVGCYRLADESSQAVVHVKVLVPIKDVYIFSVSETGDEVRIGDGEQLVMQEGQRIEYGCAASVNGSHLAPEVEVTVDGADKTKDFVAKNTAVSYPSDDDLTSFYTEQKLKFVEEKPDSSSNQKLFKCTALTRSFQSKTASAVMNIKHAPVVKCESPEFSPDGGHVTCSVKSNPTFQAKLLDEHGQEESRKTVTEQFKETDNAIQLTVTFPNHNSNYTLMLVNDVGSTSLVLDTAGPTEVSRTEKEETIFKITQSELEQPNHYPADGNQLTRSDSSGVISKLHSVSSGSVSQTKPHLMTFSILIIAFTITRCR